MKVSKQEVVRGEFGTGDALAVKLWTCVSVKNTQAMARSNFKSVSFDEMIVFIDMKKKLPQN